MLSDLTNAWDRSKSDIARAWEARSEQNSAQQASAKAGKQQSGSKHQAQIIPDIATAPPKPVVSLPTAVHRALFADQRDFKR